MEPCSFLYWGSSGLDLEILEEMTNPGHDLGFSTVHLTFLDKSQGNAELKAKEDSSFG